LYWHDAVPLVMLRFEQPVGAVPLTLMLTVPAGVIGDRGIVEMLAVRVTVLPTEYGAAGDAASPSVAAALFTTCVTEFELPALYEPSPA
jgi:hypothetical protein